jgi:hypothetical protein
LFLCVLSCKIVNLFCFVTFSPCTMVIVLLSSCERFAPPS